MTEVIVAAGDGLYRHGTQWAFSNADVTALAVDGDGWLVVLGRAEVHRLAADGATTHLGHAGGRRIDCVARFGERAVAGTAGSDLLTVGRGDAEEVERFDEIPGRDTWHTPWGAPPDLRSLASGPDGLLWANVHVGGVLVDDGSGWRQTMDIANDVHQVVAHPDHPGTALAAAAVGLGVTTDGGQTWQWIDSGLDSPYSRAVAIAGDTVFVSASSGPGGGRAAVYVGEMGGPLRRCTDWHRGNIDTGWLAAHGAEAAFLTPEGSVMVSSDMGETWEEAFRVTRPRAIALTS